MIIMVENRTDLKDCPSPSPNSFFSPPLSPLPKFSQMAVLVVSELNQRSGLEAMKFSSSAGVEKIKLLALSNTLQSANNRNLLQAR